MENQLMPTMLGFKDENGNCYLTDLNGEILEDYKIVKTPLHLDDKMLADALLKDLIKIVNPNEKVTDSRMRLANARLREYTPSEIIEAAHEFANSEWHRENKQMSIDNLLAPSKFGRWFQASREVQKRGGLRT
jgi:hypothetical protein